MGSVDDRIVAMKFDNASFEQKLATTTQSLGKLKGSLNFDQQSRGLQDLSNTSKGFSLDGISRAIESISSHFTTMGAVGFSVIQNLTSSALEFAKRTTSALTGPIISGGKERAQNIEQAKFQFRGLGVDVEKAMASALAAVQGTAFGLGDAAKAAAQLSASGISVGKDMTTILSGIAGAASMTGTSFGEIAQIFTSSAALGKVTNQDLDQFATRGLNAAAAVGKVMGKTEKQIHEMATAGTLDFKTFSDAMAKAFGENATKANETYSGSLSNMHAAMSRLGASILGPQMEHQRDLFNTITPVIDNVTKALQPLILMFNTLTGVGTLKVIDWLKGLDLTGFTKSVPEFVDGFSAIYNSAISIFHAVTAAFRDVFPKSAESKLLSFSKIFSFWMRVLTPSTKVLGDLHHIFVGIFDVISIGWTIIKNVAGAFTELFLIFGKTNGTGALDFFGNLGDKLSKLKTSLVDGGGIKAFFDKYIFPVAKILGQLDISKGVQTIIDAFDNLKESIKNFVDSNTIVQTIIDKLNNFRESISNFVADNGIDTLIDRFNKLKDALAKFFSRDTTSGTDDMSDSSNRLAQRWDQLVAAGRKLGDMLHWVLDKLKPVADAFKTLFVKIIDALKHGDFSGVHDALNTGIFATITLVVGKFIKDGFKFDASVKGFFDKISGAFEQLTGVLSAMQVKLKAEALEKIAIAVGILTASILVLSLIDSIALTKALAAVATGFGELATTMAVLDKIGGDTKDAAKLATLSLTLIGMSVAIGLLSLSVKLLSTLDPAELARGLAGVGTLLTMVAIAMKNMDSKLLTQTADGIIAISIGIGILALSVKEFAKMSPEDLLRGLLGVGALLALVATAMKNMDSGLLTKTADGIIAISIGIGILALSVKEFAKMSPEQLIQGLLGVAALLALVATAMKNMDSKLMTKTADGIIAISIGIGILVLSVKEFAKMSPAQLIQGLLGVAATLAVVAIAAHAMEGTIVGAGAIVVVAGALVALSGAITLFANIGMDKILSALLGIVVVIGVLAVGAMLLDPAIPFIAAAGAALLVLGLGLSAVALSAVLFGAGLYLIAQAITVLSEVGTEGVKKFIDVLPELTSGVVKAILEALKTFALGLPDIIAALSVALAALLQLIIDNAPKLGEAVGALVGAIATFIGDHSEEIITAGFKILTDLLKGIDDNIEDITKKVASIITKFLTALGDKAEDMVGAGLTLLTKLLKGISDHIQDVETAATTLITKFIDGISANIGKVVSSGARLITAFLSGIADNAGNVAYAATNLIVSFMRALEQSALQIVNAGFDILINFLNGLADSIRVNGKRLRDAGGNVVSAIIDGMVGGFSELGHKAVDAAKAMAGQMLASMFSIFDAHSPSREMIKLGGHIVDGLVIGIGNNAAAQDGAKKFGNSILENIKTSLDNVSTTISNMGEFNPVITPVIDMTNVHRSASEMSTLMSSPKFNPSISLTQAASMSTAENQNQATTQTAPTAPTAPTEIKFEQNNYSPQTLTTDSLYRQTKSQISLAKREL